MVAVQIPLKLAFACTAHKIQGSTVLAPKKVIVDLSSVKEPAQGYVMGSRVERIDQLFILNEFSTEKIYPSPAAMEELNHLQNKAMNNMEDQRINSNIIISLNIRSLVKHHSALCNDFQMKAKVIALQETWCPVGQNPELLQMPGYNLHLVNSGHGKGIATYFSAEFQQVEEVNREHYQMSKITSNEYDVVNVYCSKGANKVAFLNDLGKLAKAPRPCYIVGDFNVNFLRDPQDQIIKKILSHGFKQIVSEPTHIAGSLLDHVYVKRVLQEPKIALNFVYYSDHAAVSLFLNDV